MELAHVSRRLRILSDPIRLRILLLLQKQELTVTELVSILNCSQPRVSGHLARLGDDGLLEDRREGRFTFYSCRAPVDDVQEGGLLSALLNQTRQTTEAANDREAMGEVLASRPRHPLPGMLGRDYLPGRTWEGFATGLLAMLPPLRIADMGIGSGEITLLLAERAQQVIAVDPDPGRLEAASQRADRAGIGARIDFRQGDLSAPPIEAGEVDVFLFSQVLREEQDPGLSLQAARDRLAPGGRVVVLDLHAHGETWVTERLGHRHLGFSEAGMRRLLTEAGFEDVEVRRAGRDRKAPHFVSLLGRGSARP